MSVNRGGDYVQSLAQVGKAREKGPLAAALPNDTPHEGIDRSPPQETTNDTVHGAGNNFPILDAPMTRSNRNFRSTGGGSNQRDEQDLSRCALEKGLAVFPTDRTVCAGPPRSGNLGTNTSKGEIYYAVLAPRLSFSLVLSPIFFIVGIIRARRGSEDSDLHRVQHTLQFGYSACQRRAWDVSSGSGYKVTNT
jgi:hypothetical protein